MNWRTEIDIPKSPWQIKPDDRILLIGSCFTDSIGQKMQAHGLRAVCNPTGVLYNPMSIVQSLNGDMRVELVEHDGLYHSMSHHSSFSGTDSEQVLRRCLQSQADLHQSFAETDIVFVTFGTSYVYYRNGQVVANCHKLPEREFVRRRLSVQEIITAWCPLIRTMPDKHWVFTVSPIRHRRDGMHQNQLSKAVLLLAIEQLQEVFPKQVTYFPAYEIVLDELRDYRFYADDLVHPSNSAVDYIWQRLCDTFVSPETLAKMQADYKQWLRAQHRPLITE
ncbi:MAG: GSCFA domain-containing protein [Paludibacteraceae bacterium]|nr:GSCFA domain-containing protein [Paludibacteraceae bacterium]